MRIRDGPESGTTEYRTESRADMLPCGDVCRLYLIEEGGEGMDTEVAVALEGHDHEIGSLKHRVKDLEAESKALQQLAISVNKMAVNMENMLAEQRKQGSRLEVLERVPAETSKQVRAAIITALTGGVIGAIVTAVLTII